MKKAILFVFLFSVFLLTGCQERPLYRELRILMGTFVEVVSPERDAANIAFEEIKRVEGMLSKYRSESEVSRLNRAGKLNVSPEVVYIMKKAREFWQASGGAFDVSIGPLLDIWGFTDKQFRLPKNAEIEAAMRLVGFDKITIDEAAATVWFRASGMRIDLGAIAKGYAVDCAVRRLREKGVKSCVINAGGDIYCLGDRFGKSWTVAVRDPYSKGNVEHLKLKDNAVATSGDYEQFFLVGDKRYSHIFDPRTGYPADTGIASVTVIAPDCLTADALATAIIVLGQKDADKLVQKFPGVELRIIERRTAAKEAPTD